MTGPLALPIASWPDADRDLWSRLIAPADGPLGGLAHLRDASLESHAVGYGRWLGWLCREEPETMREEPVARMTADRFAAWHRSVGHLAALTRLSIATRALRVVSSAAPERDWTGHRRLLAHLRAKAADEPRSRKAGRILSSRDLFAAGLRHMQAAEALAGPITLRSAKKRRDGLMIAVLALLPLRRGTFCRLELGRSVIVGNGAIQISLDGSGMKNGMPWECAVPDILKPPLRRYLSEVRPFLAGRGGAAPSHLWLNDHGRPYVEAHLGDRIKRLTRRLLGVAVSPHLFRDAAATTLAHESPEAARLTRALLGHRTFGIAERHYNHARALEAGRQYSALIDRIKETP